MSFILIVQVIVGVHGTVTRTFTQGAIISLKVCSLVMVYSHWLGLELGPGQGQGRMGCMVLIRTFHTAPEQRQGRTPGTFSGPEEWVWYPFSGPENVPGDEY